MYLRGFSIDLKLTITIITCICSVLAAQPGLAGPQGKGLGDREQAGLEAPAKFCFRFDWAATTSVSGVQQSAFWDTRQPALQRLEPTSEKRNLLWPMFDPSLTVPESGPIENFSAKRRMVFAEVAAPQEKSRVRSKNKKHDWDNVRNLTPYKLVLVSAFGGSKKVRGTFIDANEYSVKIMIRGENEARVLPRDTVMRLWAVSPKRSKFQLAGWLTIAGGAALMFGSTLKDAIDVSRGRFPVNRGLSGELLASGIPLAGVGIWLLYVGSYKTVYKKP